MWWWWGGGGKSIKSRQITLHIMKKPPNICKKIAAALLVGGLA